MKRGELYRVRKPGGRDPKKSRVMALVSRQSLIDSTFPTVICAPVISQHHGLATQVDIGPLEGLKHECTIVCDGLISLPKSLLRDYVGTLAQDKLESLNRALSVAMGIS